MNVLPILWSPIRFIKSRCKDEIKLLVPFVIFISALLLFILDMSLMYNKIVDTLPADSEMGMATLGFSLNLLFFGINMFLFWVVGAGILACLAILLDGEGEYRRVLELTGLAHLPSLIFALIGLAIAITYSPQLRLDRLMDRDTKTMTEAQKKDFELALRKEVDQEVKRKAFVLIDTCRYAFTIWTLALCVFAVRFSFKLDTIKSALSVGGLVLLYVALEVARAKLIK